MSISVTLLLPAQVSAQPQSSTSGVCSVGLCRCTSQVGLGCDPSGRDRVLGAHQWPLSL